MTMSLARPDEDILRENLVGVQICALTLERTVQIILDWHRRGKRESISMCTAHTLVECLRTPELQQRVNRAGLATPDGMPLVWLLHRRGHADVGRVYGPDLMLALCQAGLPLGLRHYFYGAAPGVAQALSDRLQERFPGLIVAGTHAPPFGSAPPETDIDRINEAQADIVWVGLGTPKQDFWISEHRGAISATALIGVGAAFDFHSGRVRQAPAWIRRSGLEWAFRFIQEPRRLWRRYLVDNVIFLWNVILQELRMRSYPV